MVRIPAASIEEKNIQETLKLILKSAVKALRGSAGVVATFSDVDNCFRCSATYGVENQQILDIRLLLKELAADVNASLNTFTFLSKIRQDLILRTSSGSNAHLPIIILPLKIGTKTIGLIYVLRSQSSAAFSEVDQPVLQAFAEQAAIALHNASMVRIIAEEKRRVEVILENSPDGIMSIDSRCRILGFNTAMEKLTGYSRNEALGKTCSSVLKFCDHENQTPCKYKCPMIGQTEAGQVIEHEGVITTKNGKKVNVAMTYSIVRTPDNRAVNAVVDVHDISKTIEMENFRDTLLSMLGHELQTPLAIIKGYTSTLSRPDGEWDQETLKQGLHVIEEESDRLSKVMNEILLASRISGGALKMDKEPLRIPPLAAKLIRRLESITSNHVYETRFPDNFPTVKAEPRLIEQVLSNLIENAVKYSPSGGKVTVFGEKQDNFIKVTVADEGIGLDPEDMKHLFEKFHRGQTGILKKIEGTGLGLYICKSIIEAHGGSIEAANRPEKGSLFSFTLPLEQDVNNKP